MSRIGRAPITIPAGVTITVADENVVTVKGPKGELTQQFNSAMTFEQKDGIITVCRPNDEKENRALHGLTRALLFNMVEGVTNGYSKKLEIVGVGYRVEKQGKKLVLNLGYSHQVIFEEFDGITFEAPDANTIIVKGINKELVGQTAAQIREKRPPEPYKGKGIKYTGEHIRRKAGKTGK